MTTPTDDLLRRLDHPGRVDRIGHDMATLCADAAAEVRALTARLDAAHMVIRRAADLLAGSESHDSSIGEALALLDAYGSNR